MNSIALYTVMVDQITAFSCRRCQVFFVDTNLTRGEGEEVEGHIC